MPGTAAAASRIAAILTKFGRAPAAHKSLMALPAEQILPYLERGASGNPGALQVPQLADRWLALAARSPSCGVPSSAKAALRGGRRRVSARRATYSARTAHRHLVPVGTAPRLHACGTSSDEWLDLQLPWRARRLEVSVIVQGPLHAHGSRRPRSSSPNESSNRLAFPSAGATQRPRLLEVRTGPAVRSGKWAASAQLRVLSGEYGCRQQLHDGWAPSSRSPSAS